MKLCKIFGRGVKELDDPELVNHPHVQTSAKGGCMHAQKFLFQQAIAVVRHGERLDSSREPRSERTDNELKRWPHDCPLTRRGFQRSREVGKTLANVGSVAPFEVIVSSPYLRCAQSASEIARVLKLPVIFDDDLGEVGENVGKTFVQTSPPHRSPQELALSLHSDFPDVEYGVDDDGLQILGGYPAFPESLLMARTRFAKKAQHICHAAATALKSVIIVTHADAVDAILGSMKMTWESTQVATSSFFIATREVPISAKSTSGPRSSDERVYGSHTPKWQVECSPGIKYTKNSACVQKRINDLRRRHGRLHRNSFESGAVSFGPLIP